MPNVARPQPNRIGPVPFGSVDQKDRFITGLSAVFSILTKFYYLLNKTNYIHTLRAVARSGGVLLLRDRKKEKKIERERKKKMAPPSRFCSEGGGLVSCACQSVVPASRRRPR